MSRTCHDSHVCHEQSSGFRQDPVKSHCTHVFLKKNHYLNACSIANHMRKRALTKGSFAFHCPVVLGGPTTRWSWTSFFLGCIVGFLIAAVILAGWISAFDMAGQIDWTDLRPPFSVPVWFEADTPQKVEPSLSGLRSVWIVKLTTSSILWWCLCCLRHAFR